MASEKHTCRRCGACCRQGGPALHRQDLTLAHDGLLRSQLFTLRAGERVLDNVAGQLTTLTREMVKIAPAPGGGWDCRFHLSTPQALSACSIHRQRPAECRALSCRDTAPLAAMYLEDRLTRADLVDTAGALWEIIAYHDNTFPAGPALSLARLAAAGDRAALATLSETAAREDSFRQAFLTRLAIDAAEMDFYFGRDLVRLAKAFGVILPKTG